MRSLINDLQDEFETNNDTDEFSIAFDGTVFWRQFKFYRVACEMNLYYWPYDKHNCAIYFGSFLSNMKIKFFHFQEVDTMFENLEWEYREHETGQYPITFFNNNVQTVVLKHNFILSRKSMEYRAVTIIPAFVIISLILGNFLLPRHRNERILLNFIIAIIIVFYLIYFAKKLDTMSLHTPLIGKKLFQYKLNNEKKKMFINFFFSLFQYCSTVIHLL